MGFSWKLPAENGSTPKLSDPQPWGTWGLGGIQNLSEKRGMGSKERMANLFVRSVENLEEGRNAALPPVENSE